MKKTGIMFTLAAMVFVACNGNGHHPAVSPGKIAVGDTLAVDSAKKIKKKITTPAGAASTPGGIGIANGSKTVAQH